jgi:hypothetical protein
LCASRPPSYILQATALTLGGVCPATAGWQLEFCNRRKKGGFFFQSTVPVQPATRYSWVNPGEAHGRGMWEAKWGGGSEAGGGMPQGEGVSPLSVVTPHTCWPRSRNISFRADKRAFPVKAATSNGHKRWQWRWQPIQSFLKLYLNPQASGVNVNISAYLDFREGQGRGGWESVFRESCQGP